MERTPSGRPLVAADTNVLINFLHVSRLDLLCEHSGYHIVVMEHVRAEIRDPGFRAALELAIQVGMLDETTLTDPTELAIFAHLSAALGLGESAAIAVAQLRGWIIATDERRRALRGLEARLGPGRLLTTPGMLLACIRAGALTVEEADGIKAALERHRFRMRLASFANPPP